MKFAPRTLYCRERFHPAILHSKLFRLNMLCAHIIATDTSCVVFWCVIQGKSWACYGVISVSGLILNCVACTFCLPGTERDKKYWKFKLPTLVGLRQGFLLLVFSLLNLSSTSCAKVASTGTSTLTRPVENKLEPFIIADAGGDLTSSRQQTSYTWGRSWAFSKLQLGLRHQC